MQSMYLSCSIYTVLRKCRLEKKQWLLYRASIKQVDLLPFYLGIGKATNYKKHEMLLIRVTQESFGMNSRIQVYTNTSC